MNSYSVTSAVFLLNYSFTHRTQLKLQIKIIRFVFIIIWDEQQNFAYFTEGKEVYFNYETWNTIWLFEEQG